MAVTGEFIVGQNIDFQYDQDHDSTKAATKRKRRKAKKKKPARRAGKGEEDIWNTSSEEERTRIGEFWTNLSEDRRKELVKLDKELLLEKVRRQKGHDCACSVCGRKREAAEQELDALYEAYFHELEAYSERLLKDSNALNLQPMNFESEQVRGNSSDFASSRGTQESQKALTPDTTLNSKFSGSNQEGEWDFQFGRLGSQDTEQSFDLKDRESPQKPVSSAANDLKSLKSNSVSSSESFEPVAESESSFAGGILSVADDIIRNDGRRFMDVMDHLDNSRLLQDGQFQSMYEQLYNSYNQVREGMTRDFGRNVDSTERDLSKLSMKTSSEHLAHDPRVMEVTDSELPSKPVLDTLPPLPPHPPSSERPPSLPLDSLGNDNSHLTDEEYEDEEYEDEDYDDYDDELNSVPCDVDDVDDRQLSEDRLHEGRKLLQTFAARMFEQRVLHAYREHVALERQRILLEELELESRAAEEREAKKLKDKTRKKNKKLAQKQQREEEQRKREQEERERAELQRSKEEAQRAAQREQERMRAEAHRAEIAARVAEMEREQRQRESREQVERDRKKQEEERRAARELERQNRERELREKRLERERRERMRKEQEQEQRERSIAKARQSAVKNTENIGSQSPTLPVSKSSTPVRDSISATGSPSTQVKVLPSPKVPLMHARQQSPLPPPSLNSNPLQAGGPALPYSFHQQDEKPPLWGRYNPLMSNSLLGKGWGSWPQWSSAASKGPATNPGVPPHSLSAAPVTESIKTNGTSPWAHQGTIWTPPVSLESIRSAALASYQRILSQGLAVDGFVPSQVLYHATLNSLDGVRFSQNDLYQACGVAGPLVHNQEFECLRDNVGLVTHLRYIPSS